MAIKSEKAVLFAVEQWMKARQDNAVLGADPEQIATAENRLAAAWMSHQAHAKGPRHPDQFSVSGKRALIAAIHRIDPPYTWKPWWDKLGPEKNIIRKLYGVGRRVLAVQGNVGPRTLADYEAVLRHHKYDVEDWKTR
jgi:hypothetical protein